MHNLKILQRLPVQTFRKVTNFTQTASISMRTFAKSKPKENDTVHYNRKIFSGIQPTGQLHLGNYLGAIKKWIELQNNREDVSYCIVDMHSITADQNPAVLRENIFEMAATMFACGLDPDNDNLFVQSSVLEHSELCWILNCMCTMARLGHLPQFKEKSRTVKDVPLGIYVYPVLQAADIMLYKATHVPVGEDQIQHIQLAQHLARTFNNRYGPTFPICHAVIDNQEAARIRSLRNPSKKMSKSDLDTKSTIYVRDEADVIVEKIKKAVTDFTSDIFYDPINRPGVSNLIAIHSIVTGEPIEKIIDEAKTLDTGRYKLIVAEAVVEHLRPIKSQIDSRLAKRDELIHILERGADKAREHAQITMQDVKQKMGLGTFPNIPQSIDMHITKEQLSKENTEETLKFEDDGKPRVPQQKIRIESRRTIKTQATAPSFGVDLLGMPPSKPTASTTTQTMFQNITNQPDHNPTSKTEELEEKSLN